MREPIPNPAPQPTTIRLRLRWRLAADVRPQIEIGRISWGPERLRSLAEKVGKRMVADVKMKDCFGCRTVGRSIGSSQQKSNVGKKERVCLLQVGWVRLFEIQWVLIRMFDGEERMTRQIISAVIETTRQFGWMPIIVFLFHEVCAHVVDGYRLWPSVDIPLHFAGGFAMAFFISGAVQVFGSLQIIRRPDWCVHLALVFGLTCVVAVFWEFAEWTADHIFGTHCQLGLDDTLGDILMGLLGGTVFAVVFGFRMLRQSMINHSANGTVRHGPL